LRRKERSTGRNRRVVGIERPVLERQSLDRITTLMTHCVWAVKVVNRRLIEHNWDVYYSSLNDPLPHEI